jgi:hypothetical protein
MDLRQLGSLDPSLRVTTPALTRAWAVGQVLHATVVEQTGPDGFLLRAGATRFEARSPLPLQPGQQLQLQVASGGEQTVLRVLPPGAAHEPALTQALRAAVPRQADLAPVLRYLQQALTQAGTPASQPGLRQLIAQVLASAPHPESLTRPEQLQRAIVDSGVLLEAKLAQQPPVDDQRVAADLKANLLRLAEQVKTANVPATPAAQRAEPAPPLPTTATPELARQVEGALARIQVNQIASLPTEPGTPAPLIVDLALRTDRGFESVRLRVEREPPGPRAQPGEQPWAMWVELNPPGLGPVRARVATLDRNVTATFWAEHEDAAALLRAHFALLADGLRSVGLECASLACHQGDGPTHASTAPGPAGLLDERA